MTEYELIRSRRKSLAIQVKPDGGVIVRAPLRLAKYRIERFITEHEDWIRMQQKKVEKYREQIHIITEEERQNGILRAKEIFPERTAYFAKRMGVTYNRITIREQKTRWGSCSSRGTLSFNYRLIYGPAGPLDYVVVHELCHLTHMNHSKDFWNMVERIMPDYRIYKQWLREHGQELTLTTHLKKQGIPIRLS